MNKEDIFNSNKICMRIILAVAQHIGSQPQLAATSLTMIRPKIPDSDDAPRPPERSLRFLDSEGTLESLCPQGSNRALMVSADK